MARRPTILDVAQKAGVSKSTVSLVLQGSQTVKDTTRQSVRRAMKDIGYVYNRSAATLRSASSGLIGLVINDIRNPFFTEFAASLQTVLAEQGYTTVIANTDEDPDVQARMIGSLVEHGVTGLILSPAYGSKPEHLTALTEGGIPVIQVFRRLENEDSYFPLIAPDYLSGSVAATTHLQDAGCKQIAFLGGLDGRPVTMERMSGYLQIQKNQGLPCTVLTGQASRRFGREVLDTLLTDYPHVDGLLCFNDLVALGVLSACAERGVKVGRDIRVIGFDDIEASKDSFPSLSSVRCKIPFLARQTATDLLGWITDGVRPPPSTRLPVELVVRTSSEA